MADAFERNFFKPADDGYTTSAVAFNVLTDASHLEFKKKAARAKARALREEDEAKAKPKTAKKTSVLEDPEIMSIVGEIRDVEDFSNAALGERTKKEGNLQNTQRNQILSLPHPQTK